jgi:hypothetical protein
VIALLTRDEQALSLGLSSVDDAFLGFKMGDFAVLYGYSFCKTVVFLLSVRCQLSKAEGGLNSTAIYVDGGNTFNPYSISAMAQQYGLDPQSTLEKIFVSRAFTAYQLSSLILETLENALKRYGSKLVLISDFTELFLDSDVPPKESIGLFSKAAKYLAELVTRRNVIIVASCFPCERLKRRRFLLESMLFGRAGSVININESKGKLLFNLESHYVLKPFTVDLDILPNAFTLEKFVEVR